MTKQNFVIQEFEQHHLSVPPISDSEEEDLIPDKTDNGSISGLDFDNEPSPPPTPERSPSFAPSSIYHSPITGSMEEEARSDGFNLDSNEPWTLSLCRSRFRYTSTKVILTVNTRKVIWQSSFTKSCYRRSWNSASWMLAWSWSPGLVYT